MVEMLEHGCALPRTPATAPVPGSRTWWAGPIPHGPARSRSWPPLNAQHGSDVRSIAQRDTQQAMSRTHPRRQGRGVQVPLSRGHRAGDRVMCVTIASWYRPARCPPTTWWPATSDTHGRWSARSRPEPGTRPLLRSRSAGRSAAATPLPRPVGTAGTTGRTRLAGPSPAPHAVPELAQAAAFSRCPLSRRGSAARELAADRPRTIPTNSSMSSSLRGPRPSHSHRVADAERAGHHVAPTQRPRIRQRQYSNPMPPRGPRQRRPRARGDGCRGDQYRSPPDHRRSTSRTH